VWRDGRFYFTGEGSKVIGAYDPVTDHVVWIMGTGQDTTHMLVFSRDGKTIFASNRGSASVSMLELTGDSPIKAGS
jgi:streptogramin lyase